MTATAANPAAAWAARAKELAEWAMARSVNRTDVYGAYRPEEEIGKECSLPTGEVWTLGAQRTAKRPLTIGLLRRHFAARGRVDVIGAHTADAENRTKGGGLDIDCHGEANAAAAKKNEAAAIHWYEGWRRRGSTRFSPTATARAGFTPACSWPTPFPLTGCSGFSS